MRIATLFTSLGALSAIPTTVSLPWSNTTGAVLNTTRDILDTTGHGKGHGKGPQKKEIPITMKKCMGDDLNQMYYLSTKQQMVEWSDKGGRVRPGSYHAEGSQLFKVCVDKAVTWYICNCKSFWADPVPQWELDEVQSILEKECGAPWKSGWVWSKKWQKGYNVVSQRWFENKRMAYEDVCPPWCLIP